MKRQWKNYKNTMTKLLAAVLLVAMLPVTAYADTLQESRNDAAGQEVYYTNHYGVDFTKEQYDRLREFYSENEIEIMQPEFAEPLFENLYGFTMEKQYLYVQTLESVDADGNVVTMEKETVLTEEQAENLDKFERDLSNQPRRNLSATHETASKLITLKVVSLGASTAKVSLTCDWKKLPSTRSYDIMAIAPSSFVNFGSTGNFSAYVNSDAGTTYYAAAKIQEGAGIGVSVKLPEKATKYINCTFECSFAYTANTALLVNGTYQHCTSSISLSDSQKYNIKRSATSTGGVLAFTSSSVSDKYDHTAGLSVSAKFDSTVIP